MRWSALVVAALAAGGLASSVHAQTPTAVKTGEIRGRAVSSAASSGVSGATITLVGEGKVTGSGASGAFVLSGVAAGHHTVECSALGFTAGRTEVELTAGAVAQIRCVMAPQAAPKTKVAAEKAPAPPRGRTGEDVDSLLGAMDGRASASRMELGKMAMPAASVAVGGGVGYGMGYGGIGTGGGGMATGHASAGLSAASPVARAQPPMDASREGYDPIHETGFAAVDVQPLSTFSIDVDTASYTNVRRFLRGGSLPPADAVRIEEMINYFHYEYPDPTGPVPFSVTTASAEAPWNPQHRLVRVGVQGRRIEAKHLPPANLTFLIDVSGSMSDPAKLPLLKQSFRLLVDQLRPQDRVSMVVYAGAAGVVLQPTDGSEKSKIYEALDNLQAGGSTAGAEGIRLAYDVAQRGFVQGGNNRVILATDGDFNVGTSSDGELVQLIEKKRESGVFLTVLGFGMGNYQDAKMQKLADAGNGNHAYIDDLDEARKTLVGEMGATLLTIAKDVKLQVEFNPAQVKAWRLVGYENRVLAAQDFNNDKKDAGELGAGCSVTALYELVPAGASEGVPGVDALKYQAVSPTAVAGSGELMTVKLRYKDPDGDTSRLLSQPVRDDGGPMASQDDDFRFATSVAEVALLLRDSPYKAQASYAAALDRARHALGRDVGGLRSGFLELTQKAMALASTGVR